MQTWRSILFPSLVAIVVVMGASGCSRQEGEWRRIRSQDTVAGYEDYLQRHPLGSYADEARQRLRELREEREWERAVRLNAPEAFQQYLGAYPDGRFAEDARVRLADFLLAQAPSTEPVEAPKAPSKPAPVPVHQARAAIPVPADAPPRPAVRAPVPEVSKLEAARAASPSPKPVARPEAKPKPAAPAASERPRPVPPTAKTPADGKKTRPIVAPVQRRVAPASGAWRVQLGAFAAGESAARAAWDRLRSAHRNEFSGLEPEIDTLTRDGRRLWRLRAGRVDAERARSICRTLRGAGEACAVVAP